MLSAFKNFGIAFIIAAAVFALIASFATKYLVGVVEDMFAPATGGLDDILVNTSTTEPKETSEPTAEPTAAPTEEIIKGESYNMLLVVVDDRKTDMDLPEDGTELDRMIKNGDIDEDELGVLGTEFHTSKPLSIVFIRANKEKKLYTFTPLSTIMRVWSPSGDISIADYYVRYGIDGLMRKIPALTGLNADKYVVAGITNLAKAADKIGYIEFNVPTDIYTDNVSFGSSDMLKEYESATSDADSGSKPWIIIRGGVQNIDGDKLVKLMKFGETNSSTVASKASISVGCAKAYFALLSAKDTGSLQKILQDYTDNEWIKSNLTKDWFDANSGVIEAYADFDRVTLAYPASFKSQSNDYGTTVYVQPDISGGVAAFAD